MDVLVIDDIPLNRKVFKAYLSHYGVNVTTAASVLEGLKKLKSDNYDAVIIDLYLPDGDRKVILEWLNEKGNRPAKAIISSSDELSPSEEKSFICNGVLILPKPINFEQLGGMLALKP